MPGPECPHRNADKFIEVLGLDPDQWEVERPFGGVDNWPRYQRDAVVVINPLGPDGQGQLVVRPDYSQEDDSGYHHATVFPREARGRVAADIRLFVGSGTAHEGPPTVQVRLSLVPAHQDETAQGRGWRWTCRWAEPSISPFYSPEDNGFEAINTFVEDRTYNVDFESETLILIPFGNTLVIVPYELVLENEFCRSALREALADLEK